MRANIGRRQVAVKSLLGSSDVQLDVATCEVLYKGQRELLTPREYALLSALLDRPGTILSREQLEAKIYDGAEKITSNAIDVLIHGMRRKVDREVIRNVRGLGWRVESL